MHDDSGGTPRRPRDAAATRARIAEAARSRFARLGYQATAVKDVAADADVSPNLITRYFGGKEGLFLVAAEPQVAVGDVFSLHLEGFGARLARSIVERWSSATHDDPLLVLLRAAGERADAASRLATWLDEHTVERIAVWLIERGVPAERAWTRAEAIDALILGATVRRRVLRDDLGDIEALEAWLGPSIQAIAEG